MMDIFTDEYFSKRADCSCYRPAVCDPAQITQTAFFLVLWGIVIARLLIPGSVPVLPQLSPQVEVAAAIDQVNTHTAAVLQLPERSAPAHRDVRP
ncbi:hypothetical protein ACFSQ7_21120 [Paenibacillus rhizoplanae]